MRKFVAEIVEREFEPAAHDACVRNRLRYVMKQRRHLACRPQSPRSIERQQPPCLVEWRVVPNAGQYIQKLAVLLRRVADSTRRNHRQATRCGQPQQCLVASLFVPLPVPLQFDIKIAMPVDRSQPVNNRMRLSALRKRRGQWPFIASGQTDHPIRELFEIVERCRAFGLRCFAHLEARDELA